MGKNIDIEQIPLPILFIDLNTNSVIANKTYNDLFRNEKHLETLEAKLEIELDEISDFPYEKILIEHNNNNEQKVVKIRIENLSYKQFLVTAQSATPDIELLFNNHNFLNLFLNLPLGVILKQKAPKEKTLFISEYLVSKMGYTANEIALKPWRYFTYKEDINMQENIMNESIHNGLNAFFFKKRIVSKTGKIYWFSEYIKTIEHNNKQYQIILLRDISNEKEVETELHRAKQMVEDAERLKSAFLDNMPHEIRTPLHAITGFTSLLSDASLSESERLEYVKFIQVSSNDILNLMDNIIEIAKLETNQIKPKKEKCYINNILDKVHQGIQSKQNILEKEHLKIRVNKENPDPLLMIISDPERLQQILSHLLNNALKFTDHGSIEFGYTLTNDKMMEFFVKDTGIGIDPKDLDIIFRKFGKSGNINTNKNRGSGLGLALSKKLVEMLGGEIWVKSVKDEGSDFRFKLPLNNEHKISISRPSVTGEINWSGKTILVAEDTESNYFFIEAFLEKTHVNLLWAKNGNEAVEMFRQNDVHLVLMDIMMPEKDGYDATREIKVIDPQMAVIAQTALALPLDEEKCYKAGCDYVLVKPINSENLIACIKSFIA